MEVETIRQANTKWLGKAIIYEKEMKSTQEEAKRRVLEKDASNGMIVITDRQTDGRGTKGNIWYGGEGKNIAITMILFPEYTVEKLDGLTIKIAELIQEVMQEKYQIALQIKEPNDLILNHKKIAGVLIQSAIYQKQVRHLLIGIGLNINEEEFAEEIKQIATSLKKEYHKDFSREEILVAILEKLEKYFETL